jgi:hypothetical protein
MKTAFLPVVLWVAALLVAAGCATPPAETKTPLAAARGGLVPGEVQAIARQAAVARGMNLEEYNPPESPQLQIRNRRLCWVVTYRPRPKEGEPAPAARAVTIIVDDQTGTAEFPGGK